MQNHLEVTVVYINSTNDNSNDNSNIKLIGIFTNLDSIPDYIDNIKNINLLTVTLKENKNIYFKNFRVNKISNNTTSNTTSNNTSNTTSNPNLGYIVEKITNFTDKPNNYEFEALLSSKQLTDQFIYGDKSKCRIFYTVLLPYNINDFIKYHNAQDNVQNNNVIVVNNVNSETIAESKANEQIDIIRKSFVEINQPIHSGQYILNNPIIEPELNNKFQFVELSKNIHDSKHRELINNIEVLKSIGITIIILNLFIIFCK